MHPPRTRQFKAPHDDSPLWAAQKRPKQNRHNLGSCPEHSGAVKRNSRASAYATNTIAALMYSVTNAAATAKNSALLRPRLIDQSP